MIFYKLFRKKKNGDLTPLFINKKQVIEKGVNLPAEEHRTKGFAYRPFWHLSTRPEANHLKMKLASGEERVWCRVHVEEKHIVNYITKVEGQVWVLADNIKVLGEMTNEDVQGVLSMDTSHKFISFAVYIGFSSSMNYDKFVHHLQYFLMFDDYLDFLRLGCGLSSDYRVENNLTPDSFTFSYLKLKRII